MSIYRILSEDRDRDRSRILHPLSPFFQQGNLGSELPVNAECLIRTNKQILQVFMALRTPGKHLRLQRIERRVHATQRQIPLAWCSGGWLF